MILAMVLAIIQSTMSFGADGDCSSYFSTRRKDVNTLGQVYPHKPLEEIEAILKREGVVYTKSESSFDTLGENATAEMKISYLEITPIKNGGHRLNRFADRVNKSLGVRVIYSPKYLDREYAYGEFVPELKMLFVSDRLLEKTKVSAIDLHESLHGYYNKLLLKGKESPFHIEAKTELKDGTVSKFGKEAGYTEYFSFEEASTFTLTLRVMITEYRLAANEEEAKMILRSILETADQLPFIYEEARDIAYRTAGVLKADPGLLKTEVVDKGNGIKILEASVLIDKEAKIETKFLFPVTKENQDDSFLLKKIHARLARIDALTDDAIERISNLPENYQDGRTKKLGKDELDQAVAILSKIRKNFSEK